MERVRYKGMSLTPDEQLEQNGALALCANMELRNGALRPAVIAGSATPTPLLMKDDKTPVQLFYVHQTTAYRHYIGQAKYTQQALFWFHQDGERGDKEKEQGGVIKTFGEGVTITDITSVGNTIVICASDGIHYARWMPNEGTYKYVGQQPPFVKLKFSMDGPKETEFEMPKELKGKYFCSLPTLYAFDEVGKKSAFRVAEQLKPTDVLKVGSNGDGLMDPGTVDIVEEHQAQVTEEVWALINKTNAKIAEDGHFYAPFFIRYCYRMYDGSMIMHSAPIFMPAKMNKPVKAKIFNASLNSNYKWEINNGFLIYKKTGTTEYKGDYILNDKMLFHYEPYCGALQWKAVDDGKWEQIQDDWKDIIQSLDIFITPPITDLDPSELIQTLSEERACNIYYNGYIKFSRDTNFTARSGTFGSTTRLVAALDIPALSKQAFLDKIANQSAFYRLKSISTDKKLPVTAAYQEMDLDKTVVRYITTQKLMTDDYKSHNVLYAKGMFVYNRRVNAYGLKERLFSGFNATTLMPDNYSDHLTATPKSGYNATPDTTAAVIKKIAVVLQTEDGQKTVVVSESLNRYIGLIMLLNSPLFYPDARAVKMILQYEHRTTIDGGRKEFIVERDMVPCNSLNGAIAVMGDFNSISPNAEHRRQIGSFDFTTDNLVDMPSKIYTSEINNPYFFPVNGINTVGTGEIKGLAAATRALSQGQFGQFPLMAFTSDGVWALSVSQTATFSAINPVSREVCSNEKSITPIDQSVVFVTDRAINRIRESDVVNFSEILNGPYFNIRQRLPKLHTWAEENMPALAPVLEYDRSPIDAFQTAKIIYDYTNQRLLVFPDITQQQVVVFTYSLSSDTWALLVINDKSNTIITLPEPEITEPEITDNEITDNEITNNEIPNPETTNIETPPEDNNNDDDTTTTGNDSGNNSGNDGTTTTGDEPTGNETGNDDPISEDPGGEEPNPEDPGGEEPDPEEPGGDEPDNPYIVIDDDGDDIDPDRPDDPDEPEEPGEPGDPGVPYIVCEQCGATILADPGYPCPVCGYDPNAVEPDEPGGGDEPGGDDPAGPDEPGGGDADDTTTTSPILNVLNGYPFPYVQLADGTVVRMSVPYNLLYKNGTTHQGVVLTRTLKFSEVMNAVTAYCQENDMAQQPTLFLFGSNDNVNWRYIGKTNRRKADYIPGHSYRYFRVAVAFDSITTSELYYETQLGITPKYKKTT